MVEELKRKRGGQPGNQNARKHGFYSPSLDAEQRRNLTHASLLEGLDEEIGLLRVKLRSVVEHDPENIRLMTQAAGSLARLLRARKAIGGKEKISLQKAVENVVRDIGIHVDPRLRRMIAEYFPEKNIHNSFH